jgi:periplasmic protein TonB
MTTTIHDSSFNPGSGLRMFFLSAMGSAMFHAALLAGLASLPSLPADNDVTPTVQVKFVPTSQEVSPVAQPSPKPLAPARPTPSPSTPPSPQSQHVQSTPPSPLQASLKPAPSSPLVPPPSLNSAQPVLKDTRTNQALKSRHMMKMAVSPRPDQTPSPSQAAPQATPRHESPPARMPVTTNGRQPPAHHALPPPRTSTAPPALKALQPVSTGSSTSSPMIVSSSKPLYPRVARESGWEGTVIIRTLITPDGVPSQVEIRKSCGHETLDLAAQEAIKRWKFQPAKDGNIPIAKWVDIPIKFDLNG